MNFLKSSNICGYNFYADRQRNGNFKPEGEISHF